MNPLPHLLTIISWINAKKSLIAVMGVFAFLVFYLGKSIFDNIELQNINSQLKLDNDGLKKENNNLRSKLGVLGQDIERYAGMQKNISDFKRDWDISSFNLISDDIFCPRKKGDNNYQRMFYKYGTPLTETDFNLKFQMVDQDEKIIEYTQRVLTGLKSGDEIFTEFDIPTRDNPVVNFRVASDNDSLISGGPGKPLSSPIKDKSIINLKFRTQFKSNQEITEFIDLAYFSSISDYGDESETISYDAKVNDSRPETARANLFIGSYIGGCIKIIDWHAS